MYEQHLKIKDAKNILIVIRRSNGDVLLSASLINIIKKINPNIKIDLIINDDTSSTAHLLPHVNKIYEYSYSWKNLSLYHRFKKNIGLISSVFRKYDLAVSLVTTDSSILFASIASTNSIGAIDNELRKNWWKKILLSYYYKLEKNHHMLINHMKALSFIEHGHSNMQVTIKHSQKAFHNIALKLKQKSVDDYIVFHISAQYKYKTYPLENILQLLNYFSSLKVSIILTGGKSNIDFDIKSQLFSLPHNVHDFIGETTLDEYVALSSGCLAYVGADTLNMHIAAAQNKKIFALFGPTYPIIWSPWSNTSQRGASTNYQPNEYGTATIFQSSRSCVPCGQAGCNNDHVRGDCMFDISPKTVYEKVENYIVTNEI